MQDVVDHAQQPSEQVIAKPVDFDELREAMLELTGERTRTL